MIRLADTNDTGDSGDSGDSRDARAVSRFVRCLLSPPAPLPAGDLYAHAAGAAAGAAAAAARLGDVALASLYREQALLRARTAAAHRESRRGWGPRAG